MYDLPSEDPEEPGLPDEFHDLQPQLLSATLRLMEVSSDRIFTGTDLNLYYDSDHPLWHKRPDWFVAIGVPRLYAEQDLRLSYVVWDEGVNPFVVVELLSPGTEKEDLGQTQSAAGEPPTKWQVYEQILKVPYYILYDRYSGVLRAYSLVEERYQAIAIVDHQIWLPELKIGLGLWQGEYDGINRQWLRWLDAEGNWIPTRLERTGQQIEEAEQQLEQAEQQLEEAEQQIEEAEHQLEQAEQQIEEAEQQREQERQQRLIAEQKMARMAEQLRALGIDPDEQ
jgi:Uma2 family endonuclease/exonuclease VII small subunit